MKKNGLLKISVIILIIYGVLVLIEKILLWTGCKSLLYYISFILGYVIESISRMFSS